MEKGYVSEYGKLDNPEIMEKSTKLEKYGK